MIPDVATKSGTFPFDPKKMYLSISNETDVPKDKIKEIMEETCRFLIGMNLDFVSAPMIRVIVQVQMLKLKLEAERLQYTRIGVPFADLKVLFETSEDPKGEIYEWVRDEYEAVKNHVKDAKERVR
jgi:ribonucleoside-triphosphate reductase